MNILDKHPTPWEVLDKGYPSHPCIRDANDAFVLGVDYEVDILNFIAEIVNNSVRPIITDADVSRDQLKAIIEVQKSMARLNEVGMVVFGINEIYDGKLITFKRELLQERKSGESEIIWTKERLDWIEYATIRCPYLDRIEVST